MEINFAQKNPGVRRGSNYGPLKRRILPELAGPGIFPSLFERNLNYYRSLIFHHNHKRVVRFQFRVWLCVRNRILNEMIGAVPYFIAVFTVQAIVNRFHRRVGPNPAILAQQSNFCTVMLVCSQLFCIRIIQKFVAKCYREIWIVGGDSLFSVCVCVCACLFLSSRHLCLKIGVHASIENTFGLQTKLRNISAVQHIHWRFLSPIELAPTSHNRLGIKSKLD